MAAIIDMQRNRASSKPYHLTEKRCITPIARWFRPAMWTRNLDGTRRSIKKMDGNRYSAARKDKRLNDLSESGNDNMWKPDEIREVVKYSEWLARAIPVLSDHGLLL